jgi:hypothetical protein
MAEYVAPRVTMDVDRTKDIVIHPSYDPAQIYNNVALIKLPFSINIKTRTTKLIPSVYFS